MIPEPLQSMAGAAEKCGREIGAAIGDAIAGEMAKLNGRAVAAERERDQLREWKESALSIEKSWNPQDVANLLGMPLGVDIRANIQPSIERLLRELDELRAEVASAKIAGLKEAARIVQGISQSDGRHGFILSWVISGIDEHITELEKRK